MRDQFNDAFIGPFDTVLEWVTNTDDLPFRAARSALRGKNRSRNLKTNCRQTIQEKTAGLLLLVLLAEEHSRLPARRRNRH